MATNKYLVYVEDDEDDLMLVEEIMDDHDNNISLVTLKDGQELLDFLEDQRDGDLPLMIIMDNNTPRLNGMEAAGILKRDQEWRQIDLIILTTSASPAFVNQLKEQNVKVITKPSTYTEWQELFNTFLKEIQ